MKLILLVTLIIFSSRLNAQKKATNSAHPSMQKTASWLNTKYNELKKDTAWGRFGIINNYICCYTYYSVKEFLVNNRIFKINMAKVYVSGNLPDQTETEIVLIDLAAIDSLIIGSDHDDFLIVQNVLYSFGNDFYLFKTKNGYNGITINWGDTITKTSKFGLPFIKQDEPDIQNRFLKALRYYIKLCKQKYPPKKDIF